MLAHVLALTLARPTEVADERILLRASPLSESVSARAYYRRDEGPSALLPDAVQGDEQPSAHAVGYRDALVVRRGAEGWEVTLPAGTSERVRVVAQLVRPVYGARLFRVQWPEVRASREPVRRMMMLPRGWLAEMPPGWICPEEAVDEVPCVSTARAPQALLARFVPPRSSRLAIAAALLALVASLASAWLLGDRAARRARLVGALAGATVGLALSLGVVGAGRGTWALGLALCVPLPALAGALAPRRPLGVAMGSLALLVVPLVVVINGSLRATIVSGVGAVVATVLGGLFGRPAPPKPASTPPSVPSAPGPASAPSEPSTPSTPSAASTPSAPREPGPSSTPSVSGEQGPHPQG